MAETGSGKTGAFALPILNALLETPQRLFALVLTPTRELAFQISEQFEALGSSIGVQCGECRRSSKRPGCHHKWGRVGRRGRRASAGSVLWSEELVGAVVELGRLDRCK